MCATKPPPSRCVIGINFPGPWTRVRLPDDGLLAAPEGRLYWHLHRRCTMHALHGVRRAVGNEPRAACLTRAEPQSKPIDELCRQGAHQARCRHQPGAVSAGLLSSIKQQRRYRTPACAASDGHNKDGTSPNYGKKHHRSSGSVRSARAGSAASQSSNAASARVTAKISMSVLVASGCF